MYCLFAVMWCDTPESHAHLSASFTLFTLTAKNAETLVSSIDDEPMLSGVTDLFLSAFSYWQFMFRWPTFPQWKQLQFSLVSLVDFFDPPGLLDVVLITRFRDYVVDACAMNALDSAAVVNVCNRFSIVNSFSSRLFFVHLLSSSNSQVLLTYWYSGPVLPRSAYAAVQRYVVRLSPTLLCIHVRERLLNFSDIRSNVHFCIALELEELRHQRSQSLNTAFFIDTDEHVPHVLGITVRQYPIRNRFNSAHSRSTPPSGHCPASTPTNIFYHLPTPFHCSLYWDTSNIR